jgi:hypothetical protein
MRVELLFPSKYIRCADLRGKDVTKTIAKVQVDALQMKGGKKEKKPVIYFSDSEKMLVLNKTNAMAIAKYLGPETDAWAGKQVTLMPAKDRMGPDIVDCVRIKDCPGNDGGSGNEDGVIDEEAAQ